MAADDDDDRGGAKLPAWVRSGRRLDERAEASVPLVPDEADAPMDRKTFLREGATAFRAMGSRIGALMLERVADRVAPALMRPPGALPEGEFLQQCTRCNACVEACHQESILVADGRKGLSVHTPYLDVMNHNACFLCTNPPCIAACPSGALQPTPPTAFRLGLARILEHRCLAFAGEDCSRCVTRCPYEGRAIRVDDEGLPRVDADHCTGCGLCFSACPTQPRALVIDPRS